jgi:hypothetical protein
MKSLFIAAALLAAALPAQAQTNVSINIGQPGFYGRIDIGDYVPPPVVYVERPVVVERHARATQPVYLRVPPGHRKNWARHCGRYNACGQRVLFVRDEWYTNSYAPRYREHYRDRDERRDDRDDHRDERRDYRDDDRGHGGKHGRGHDKHDKHDDKGHGKGHGRHD